MNTAPEFPIPVTCKFSAQQSVALEEFTKMNGFDGLVSIHFPTFPSGTAAPDSAQIKRGIRMLLNGEKTLPFSLQQALALWLEHLMRTENNSYFGTTTCHSTDEEGLRSALNLIADSIGD